MQSQRAQIFADACALASGENCLHIYDDAYVVTVACSMRRHAAIRRCLDVYYPEAGQIEEARSSDGFLSIFVVVGIRPPVAPSECGIVVPLTDSYHDHRAEDDHLIDEGAGLLLAVVS